ncbi:MAG TPA: ABC transporter substrate binding protein [Chloroflexota bacterium]|nr:ABC transporter substrate binding protein [Chloroflexota bacterium]
MTRARAARRPSRRQVLRGAGLAGIGWLAACAQVTLPTMPSRRPAVVGLLAAGPPPPRDALAAFLQGLAERGWALGHNLVLAERSADGQDDRLPDLAAALLALPPDALVTVGTPATRAAAAATTAIPIVFASGRKPAAPAGADSGQAFGGNVTGIATGSAEVTERRLMLLAALAPGVARVAVLACEPATPPAVQQAAQAAGVQLYAVAMPSPGGLSRSLEAAAAWGAEALLIEPPALTPAVAAAIAAFAADRRLPALAAAADYPRAGGLAAYAPRLVDGFRRAAAYVDQVLRGTPPAALPVEPPGALDLVLSQRAARALGLSFSADLLRQAAEVIS